MHLENSRSGIPRPVIFFDELGSVVADPQRRQIDHQRRRRNARGLLTYSMPPREGSMNYWRVPKPSIGILVLAVAATFSPPDAYPCGDTIEYCQSIDIAWDSPSAARQPPTSQFKILGLQLLTSDINEVRKRFGKSESMDRDECGGEDFCFESPRDDKPATLIVDLWGDHLRGFTVIASRLKNRHCFESRLVTDNLGTEGGVRLGMTSHEVARVLGMPQRATPEALAYSFETRPRMTESDLRSLERHWPRTEILSDPYWNDWSTIEVGLRGSRVECFHVQRTRIW